MYSFNYVKANSLREAREFLKSNPDARPLAGGMTLIPTLKARLAQPSHLVDIGALEELRGIELQGSTLSIGAATRHNDVLRSEKVRQAIPALAELAGRIGDPAVRNLGTMGGSLANNDPAADYPAAALGLNAKIVTDRREIAADDFFQGMFTTALEPGELIVRIAFPVPKRAAYEKFAHPASGYAMTGVFVAETASDIRVAVTGAGPGVSERNPSVRDPTHFTGFPIAFDAISSAQYSGYAVLRWPNPPPTSRAITRNLSSGICV